MNTSGFRGLSEGFLFANVNKDVNLQIYNASYYQPYLQWRIIKYFMFTSFMYVVEMNYDAFEQEQDYSPD